MTGPGRRLLPAAIVSLGQFNQQSVALSIPSASVLEHGFRVTENSSC